MTQTLSQKRAERSAWPRSKNRCAAREGTAVSALSSAGSGFTTGTGLSIGSSATMPAPA